MRRAYRLQFLAFLLCSVAGLLPQSQKDSLLTLYESTGGPFWSRNDNWNVTADPCGNPPWIGVTCDPLGQNVKELYFYGNNLTGTLPDLQLPALTNL